MLKSTISGTCLLLWAGAGGAAADPLEDANRTLVRSFYELAFVQHRPDAAADAFIGPVYVQHDPKVPNGAAPFVGYFKSFFSQHPTASSDIGRILADGDLVAVHSHATTDRNDRGMAIVDIFRVSQGKIVEHWDVMQDVPDGSANGHTMFDGPSAP